VKHSGLVSFGHSLDKFVCMRENVTRAFIEFIDCVYTGSKMKKIIDIPHVSKKGFTLNNGSEL